MEKKIITIKYEDGTEERYECEEFSVVAFNKAICEKRHILSDKNVLLLSAMMRVEADNLIKEKYSTKYNKECTTAVKQTIM